MRKAKTSEQCKKQIKDYFEKMNYIPQKDEQIKQCPKPYPHFWFCSSKGYLFTTSEKEVKILPPHLTPSGRKNINGERAQLEYRYYYGKNKHVKQQKLIVDTFNVKNEFDEVLPDSQTEIHHQLSRKNFTSAEPQKMNRLDNIQVLPKSIHQSLTNSDSFTKKVNDMFKQVASDDSIPVFECDLEALLSSYVQSHNGVAYDSFKNEDGQTVRVVHFIKKSQK